MSDNPGTSAFANPSRSRTWVFCGALLVGGVMGFLISHYQYVPLAPIVAGLIILSLIFTKLPMVKPIKPTLGMLAVTAIVCGAVDMMLSDQGFRAHFGHRITGVLYRLKLIFLGMGLGAVLLSLFYGHWSSALKAAQQSPEIEARFFKLFWRKKGRPRPTK